MSEQIFISYRRDGGDVTAKLICEALKNRGFTVFYDYDSLQGGYFDSRIMTAIEGCHDFVLVLPHNALDRCVNEDDWVRLEIRHAIKHGKNIIPVMLPGFNFPTDLPADIESIARINGIKFVMDYFDATIDRITERLSIPQIVSPKPSRKPAAKKVKPSSAPKSTPMPKKPLPSTEAEPSQGLEFVLNSDGNGYSVRLGSCTDYKIVIPKTHKNKPVTKIDDTAFFMCSFLQSITIPDSITSIGKNAFCFCYSLDEITIPDSVTTIGKAAFGDCSRLIDINIPNGVTAIEDGTFERCKSLTDIDIPDSVTKIGNYAFGNCTSLTHISIPDSVTKIGYRAFHDCSALSDVSLPNNLQAIESGVFDWCRALTDIAIPHSVKSIGSKAFAECTALTDISIPSNVTKIGKYAFESCNSFRNIYYSGTVKQFKKLKLGFKWQPSQISTVRCIDGNCRIRFFSILRTKQ